MENSIYEQPQVEVIEIEVEQSFASSGNPGSSPWENY